MSSNISQFLSVILVINLMFFTVYLHVASVGVAAQSHTNLVHHTLAPQVVVSLALRRAHNRRRLIRWQPTTGGGSSRRCPIDALKLGVCANVLGGLLNLNIGTPPRTPCCSLIQGLLDVEAAVCLCTAIRANILGINLNIPLSLSLLVNYCGGNVPSGFQCP